MNKMGWLISLVEPDARASSAAKKQITAPDHVAPMIISTQTPRPPCLELSEPTQLNQRINYNLTNHHLHPHRTPTATRKRARRPTTTEPRCLAATRGQCGSYDGSAQTQAQLNRPSIP